jgi:hypothetical protein
VEAGAEAVHICLQLRHRGDALDLSLNVYHLLFTP